MFTDSLLTTIAKRKRWKMIKFYIVRDDNDLIAKVYNSEDEARKDVEFHNFVEEADLVNILNELLGRMANK